MNQEQLLKNLLSLYYLVTYFQKHSQFELPVVF
jgi:hypothetical protein